MSLVFFRLRSDLPFVKITFQEDIIKWDVWWIHFRSVGHVQDIHPVHLDDISCDRNIMNSRKRNDRPPFSQFERPAFHNHVHVKLISDVRISTHCDPREFSPDPVECSLFYMIRVRVSDQQCVHFVKVFLHFCERDATVYHDIFDSYCVPGRSGCYDVVIKRIITSSLAPQTDLPGLYAVRYPSNQDI